MKVILCEHVSNLGEMGQTVSVADGYARNYLIPRKLAVNVESASARQIEHEMRIIRKREERVRAHLREVAKRLEEMTFEFKARAGQDEKLFGSVTSAQIAEKLKEAGFEVDRRGVALHDPIKQLGIYTVPVKLGSGVEASVKVWVQSEEPLPVPELEDEPEELSPTVDLDDDSDEDDRD